MNNTIGPMPNIDQRHLAKLLVDRENSRNGTRTTVQTEAGAVDFEVPRDREGTFEPRLVRKRQRRRNGIDEIVLSLTARGLTTGEDAAHFAEVYGAKVVQGHHQPDHRQGGCRDDRVGQPAAGPPQHLGIYCRTLIG